MVISSSCGQCWGTVSLMAAMNVTTGTVHSKIIERNDSDTFIRSCNRTVKPFRWTYDAMLFRAA